MIILGKLIIRASRWPWQRLQPGTSSKKYGWRSTPGFGRFGGGWDWKFGVEMSVAGGFVLIINLIFGRITITF